MFDKVLNAPLDMQKQPFMGVLRKRCSENIQQIYWKTPIPKCGISKFPGQLYWNRTSHGCSPVNLLHIFRKRFPKNIYGGLLLDMLGGKGLLKISKFVTSWTSVLSLVKLHLKPCYLLRKDYATVSSLKFCEINRKLIFETP